MKATEIARLHHYAPDYIGQLCRSRKIDAKLAGRTWYATEASFKAYQNGRYGGQTATATPVSAVLETTPTAKREAVTNAHSSDELPVPKIAVPAKKPTKAKQPTARTKKVAPAPKKVAAKKTSVQSKPKAPKKAPVTKPEVVDAPTPVPTPAEQSTGIRGLFKRFFGR